MDQITEAFDLLGLPADASLKDVRSSYRALVREWHPDRFSDDPKLQQAAQERLKAINAAYNIARKNIRKSVVREPRMHDSPFRFDGTILTPRPPVPDAVHPARFTRSEENKSPALARPWLTNVLFCIAGLACFCLSVTRFGFSGSGLWRFVEIMIVPAACGGACNFSPVANQRLRLGYIAAVLLLGVIVVIDAASLKEAGVQTHSPVAVDEAYSSSGRGVAGGLLAPGASIFPGPAPRSASDGPTAPTTPQTPTSPVAPAPFPPSAPVAPTGK